MLTRTIRSSKIFVYSAQKPICRTASQRWKEGSSGDVCTRNGKYKWRFALLTNLWRLAALHKRIRVGCFDAVVLEQLLKDKIIFLYRLGKRNSTEIIFACSELWPFTCMDQLSLRRMKKNYSQLLFSRLVRMRSTLEECQWITTNFRGLSMECQWICWKCFKTQQALNCTRKVLICLFTSTIFAVWTILTQFLKDFVTLVAIHL